MSKPSGASLINFVWFLLFAGCVGGLIVWGVDASQQPAPAPGSSPESVARVPEEDGREGRRREHGPHRDRRSDARDRSESRETTALPVSSSANSRPGSLESRTAKPSSTDARSIAPQGFLASSEGQRLVAKTQDTPAIRRTEATGSSPAGNTSRRVPAGYEDMVRLSGGRFRMGSDRSSFLSEKPAHDVSLRPFWIDRHEVTRDQFARFVEATGHRTTAERQGWAPVFNPKTDEWEALDLADWRRPRGPEGRASDPEDPVTQVSWEDASAYARWAGKRLPSEAEWEYAARGGLVGANFPWGNELMPEGKYVSNFWQGPFPVQNTREDGFRGPAPVGTYPPNGYGLYDMSGNVWEWCADWFSQSYYRKTPLENPPGPDHGAERVQRGGSWFCSPNSNPGYMVYSRMSAPPAAMYPHVGFRCAKDE